MITSISSEVASSKNVNGEMKSRAIMTLAGLSTDTKPTVSYKGVLIANGSVCFAMDTSTAYMYDEDGTQWHVI